MTNQLPLAALCFAVLLPLSFVARPAEAQILQTFLHPTPHGLNDFGTAVAVVGDLVAINSRGGPSEGQRGVVDLFDVASAQHVGRVDRPVVGPVVRSFGRAMVTVGERLAVADRGYVYVFEIDRDGPDLVELVQTITPPVSDSEFGSALAAAGSRLVVGGGGEFVYVYDPATGALLRSLQSGVQGDSFGISVAGADGLVLIGAPTTTVEGLPGAGAAYLFRIDSGEMVRTIFEPELALNSLFGISVAFAADRLAVGALHEGPAGEGGGVHLFDAATGSHTRTLRSPVAFSTDRFGIRTQAQGGRLAVTAGRFTADGTVYVFDVLRSDASPQILRNPGSTFSGSGTNQVFFGFATAFVGHDILVGAPKNNFVPDVGPVLIGEGAAFLFEGVAPAEGGIVASLETPAEGAVMAGIVPVQGWAFTTVPGAEIERLLEVDLDGKLAFRVPCCSDRGDVEAAFPGEAPELSGFSGTFNWQLPEPGEHELEIRIFDTAGNVTSIHRTIRTVRLANASFVRDASWDLGGFAGVTILNGPGSSAEARLLMSGLRFTTSDGSMATCAPPNAIIFSWDRAAQGFRQVTGCAPP